MQMTDRPKLKKGDLISYHQHDWADDKAVFGIVVAEPTDDEGVFVYWCDLGTKEWAEWIDGAMNMKLVQRAKSKEHQ